MHGTAAIPAVETAAAQIAWYHMPLADVNLQHPLNRQATAFSCQPSACLRRAPGGFLPHHDIMRVILAYADVIEAIRQPLGRFGTSDWKLDWIFEESICEDEDIKFQWQYGFHLSCIIWP